MPGIEGEGKSGQRMAANGDDGYLHLCHVSGMRCQQTKAFGFGLYITLQMFYTGDQQFLRPFISNCISRSLVRRADVGGFYQNITLLDIIYSAGIVTL